MRRYQAVLFFLAALLLAAYPFGQFFGAPVLGSLSDDYGRKRTITFSLIVAAFCYLVTGIAIHMRYLELLILSRFATGLMEGNIAVARAMAAGDLHPCQKQAPLEKSMQQPPSPI